MAADGNTARPSPRAPDVPAGHHETSTRPLETMLPEQVAARLGVSESCLAKWRMHGKGPAFVRVSHRRVVYPVPEFNAFLASRTRVSTIDPGAALGHVSAGGR